MRRRLRLGSPPLEGWVGTARGAAAYAAALHILKRLLKR
jgi:hypothetical protein